MKRTIALVLLIAGIALVVLGFVRKDEGQANIGIGKAEITIGKSDSAFSGYFILGGVLALAGLVTLSVGRDK